MLIAWKIRCFKSRKKSKSISWRQRKRLVTQKYWCSSGLAIFFFIFVNKLQADLLPLMTTLPIFNTIYLWSGTHLSVIPCAGAKLRSLAKTFLLSTVILSLLKAGKHHAQLNKYLTTEAALVQPASHGTMIFEYEISQRDQVSKYLYLSLTAVEVNPETCICFKRILQAAERESAYNHNAWIRKKKHVLL